MKRFVQFFGPSAAHNGQLMYRMDAVTGNWIKVTSSEPMKKGAAYWVYRKGGSTYQGPLRVSVTFGDGLDFGGRLSELVVHVTNESSATLQYTISPKDSEASSAAAVPLSYWRQDFALAEQNCPSGDLECWKQYVGWQPLEGALPAMSIAGKKEYTLRLAVRREEMVVKALRKAKDGGSAPSSYKSVLNISGGAGQSVEVPITAQGLAPASTDARAGLWVGTATVDLISQHNPATDTVAGSGQVVTVPAGYKLTPVKASGAFTFRLIVHVDAAGQPRLLQQVTQLWKNGTPGSPGSGGQPDTPVVPGEYALFADDSYAQDATYQGATLKDGVPVGRRVTAPNFAFKEPLAASAGHFPGPGAIAPTPRVKFAVGLDFDDPRNPFKHKYNPDHDNLDGEFHPLGHEGESFTVTRAIALEFSQTDPSNLQNTPAGLGGFPVGRGVQGDDHRAAQRQHQGPGHVPAVRVSDIAVLHPTPAN